MKPTITENLNMIKNIIKKEQYEDALHACEKMLETHPENTVDVLRVRAYAFARQNNYQQAIEDYKLIFKREDGAIRDHYLAADYALYAGEFTKAEIWFKKTLILSDEQNEIWFKAATFFLLAYTQMWLSKYHEAIINLDNAIAIDPDVAMPLPFVSGMCGHQQLREQINYRAKQ
jgi:tetratricopeptide (TPR) repeat protein